MDHQSDMGSDIMTKAMMAMPVPTPPIQTDFSLLLGPVGMGLISFNPNQIQPVDPFLFTEACVAKAVGAMFVGGAMVCL
jgi:hypothetical protein